MIFDIGLYQLNIDVERTDHYYREQTEILCDCDGCQNYGKAAATLPEPVLRFLRQFGIDPAKPAEVYVNYAPSQDTVFYEGFYYICGTILKGTEPWVRVDDKQHQFDEPYRIHLGDGFSVYMMEPQWGILDKDFPTPVIQMEISFILPWLLDKPNSYLR